SVVVVTLKITINGTADNDDISVAMVKGSTSQLVVNRNGDTSTFKVSDVQSIVINGRTGDDVITAFNNNGVVPFSTHAKGGKGKDTITGGNFDDTLFGGLDHDQIT